MLAVAIICARETRCSAGIVSVRIGSGVGVKRGDTLWTSAALAIVVRFDFGDAPELEAQAQAHISRCSPSCMVTIQPICSTTGSETHSRKCPTRSLCPRSHRPRPSLGLVRCTSRHVLAAASWDREPQERSDTDPPVLPGKHDRNQSVSDRWRSPLAEISSQYDRCQATQSTHPYDLHAHRHPPSNSLQTPINAPHPRSNHY